MPKQGVIVRAKDSECIWLLRDHLMPLVGPELTSGSFALAIGSVHPGDGPPPHIHRREDEAFYVLEGEMTYLTHDKLVVAKPGTFVWGPRDVIHAFRCTSSTPAKHLLFVAPTQFLEFAMTLAEPAPDFMSPPEVGPEKIMKLMQVAPEYGIEMRLDHAMPTVVAPEFAPMKRVWALGEDVSYLATSAETNGQFTIVEIRSAPGGGPPPHIHTGQDEVFYVISGAYSVEIDGRTETIGPGDVAFIPRGVRHRYTSASDGKLLSIHTPGGFERFFDDVGIEHRGEDRAPVIPPVSPQQLTEILARHGMTT